MESTEKHREKEFGDGFIVNFYDTNGRLFWRYERYWNSIGRFAKGDYRYSKRFTYDEKGNLIRMTEKQTPPCKTPSMMITDFQYDETNGLICVKRKHSERSMTSFYDGEQLEMEPLSETEAMDLPSELHRFWERDKASVGKITWDKGKAFLVIRSLTKKMAKNPLLFARWFIFLYDLPGKSTETMGFARTRRRKVCLDGLWYRTKKRK